MGPVRRFSEGLLGRHSLETKDPLPAEAAPGWERCPGRKVAVLRVTAVTPQDSVTCPCSEGGYRFGEEAREEWETGKWTLWL